jgi:hypothetical protein
MKEFECGLLPKKMEGQPLDSGPDPDGDHKGGGRGRYLEIPEVLLPKEDWDA